MSPSASHIQASKCLTTPIVSHDHVYSFGVSCPFNVSHIQVPVHSASPVQVSHTFKRFMSKCLTHSSVSCPSVSHIQAFHVQVSHTFKCLMSKCLMSKCLTHSSASHIQAFHVQVPHTFKCLMSKCLFIQCLMSKCLFIQCLMSIHLMSHTFKRLTYPSAYSSVSHNHVYSFGVSCLFNVSHIQVPIHSSVSHIQASHIIMSIHSVYHDPSAPHIQASHTFIQCHTSKYLFIQCHMSKCLFVQCPMSPIVSYNHAYSFGATRPSVRLFHVSYIRWILISCPAIGYLFIRCLVSQVPRTFKRLTYPSAPHIKVPHISKCLFIRCIMSPIVSHNHAYSFDVPHPSAYSFSVSCPRSSHIIMRIHSASHIQAPIHSVSHVSNRLT